MDRFLDENESAASSRASSPHNFTTSRAWPGNGIAPTTIQTSSQSVAIQPTYTIGAPTAAQSTVVTINGSNSNASSVSLPRRERESHENPTNRQVQQQQSCVPTSVIVSGPDSGGEPPTKKLKILPGSRPKLINSMLSKPPPLKPIVSAGSGAFHPNNLGSVPLPPTSVSSFNTSNSHEPSYLPVQNTPAVTDSLLFTHNKWCLLRLKMVLLSHLLVQMNTHQWTSQRRSCSTMQMPFLPSFWAKYNLRLLH